MRRRNTWGMPPSERLEFYSMPIPECGCHVWIGSLNIYGYGMMRAWGQYDHAHRQSWRVHRGPIPKGMSVLHKCDERSCINPDHLFLGTQADNMRDRDSKGRQARGENHNKAKLTEADVIAIRKTLTGNDGELAAKFGVHRSNIGYIRRRITWKHLL